VDMTASYCAIRKGLRSICQQPAGRRQSAVGEREARQRPRVLTPPPYRGRRMADGRTMRPDADLKSRLNSLMIAPVRVERGYE